MSAHAHNSSSAGGQPVDHAPATEVDEQVIRQLRHDLRGRMHALKLTIYALDTDLTPTEAVEFLADVELACDRVTEAINAFETAGEGTTDEHG